LGRNHLHDFTLAETPTAAEFSARDRALLYKFINGSRMDLQQVRHLGRGENLFHRYIPPSILRGYPDFLNWQQCCQQISDSALKEKTLMPKTSENF
jgi:hypothetical protein